jgi:aryl-alcohol dehydrogenase-like predicted oxidoreductase
MKYRQLGRSGLRVSELTLGTMGFGGSGKFRDVGEIDVDGARRQIDMALDAGVNLIDTADVYSAGASEEVVGRGRQGSPRQTC